MLRRAAFFALCLGSTSCNRDPPQCPATPASLSLLGQRALIAGTSTVPSFDSGALPYFRASGELEGRYRARLTAGATVAATLALTVTTTRSELSPGSRLSFLRSASWPAIGERDATLVLERDTDDCPAELGRWAIRWRAPPEQITVIRSARALKQEQKTEAALRLLEEALPSLSPWEQSFAAQELARMQQAKGELERAAASWKRAAEIATAAHLPTQASWAWRSAAYQCYWLRCFAEARPLLERAEALDARLGNELGLARVSYYRALLAQQLGEYLEADHLFSAARATLHDLGLPEDAARAGVMHAVLLSEHGRPEASLALLDQLEPFFTRAAKPAERASYDADRGFIQLRAGLTASARATMERALEQMIKLRDPTRQANLLLGLAQAAVVDGDAASARARLQELERTSSTFQRHPQTALLRADIDLLDGDLDAAQRDLDRARALAAEETPGGDSDDSWRALRGLARLRLARGDRRAARALLAQAVDTIERLSRRTALSAARAGFFSERDRVFDEAFSLALEERDLESAFALAERLRASFSASLETSVRIGRLSPQQRAQWERELAAYLHARSELDSSRGEELLLRGGERARWRERRKAELGRLRVSFDELWARMDALSPPPPPSAGLVRSLRAVLSEQEALLSFSRFGQRWHAFYLDQRTLDTWISGEVLGADTVLSEHLRAFADRRDAHLYVVPGGLSAAEGLAELALGRAVLLEGTSISFLPNATSLLSSVETATGAAVVVADPAGNLPYALREGEEVARQLGAGLFVQSRAQRSEVLPLVATARVFHFAGHGELRAEDPWDAHLGLASDQSLSLEDILTLRLRPRLVVLNGCQTGRSTRWGSHASIGLAEAFLIAGARGVLASDEVIADARGAAFVKRFYQLDGADRPRQAFQRAALATRAEGDDTWRAFRWWGR